jgi:hypothetical protein
MDKLLMELLAVNSETALNFFTENLRNTTHDHPFREDETAYVASILSHYSLTSRADATSLPSLADLSEVFDMFIMSAATRNDSEILEIGGSQILLFAGFFRDQMSRRHNVDWYDHLGQSMYERASHTSSVPQKRELFDHLAASFPDWTIACRNLNRALREDRLLLKLN